MREDLAGELLVWRPILERLVSLEAVLSGECDLVMIYKLNALMDMRYAAEKRDADVAAAKARHK